MNGLGAPQAQALAQEAPQSIGGDQQASPEEQAMLERFVGRAFQLVYNPETFPKVIDVLDGEGDPKTGLADATTFVLMRVIESAKEAGQELDGEVLMAAGQEVFQDLGDLSANAGIFDFMQDPDALEGAYFLTLDRMRDAMQNAGMIDPNVMQEDMARLQSMNESGELESMIMNQAEAEGANQ